MSKKQKKTVEELVDEALVPAEEQPYQVPENWIWVRLGSLLELVYGKSLPKKKRSGEGYPVYGSNGVVDLHDEFLTEGPFIIVGRKGSHGEVNWSEKSGWPIDTTYFVRANKRLNLKMIYYLLTSLNLKRLNRSTAIPGLNREDAYNENVPLPPLNEQKRITNKIERLLGKVDQAKQLIEEAKETFELRRAAILDKAFRGELTKEWRGSTERSPNAFQTKSKDNEGLFELPEGWQWKTVEEICEDIIDCPHSTPKYIDKGGYPAIRTSDIGFSKLSTESAKKVSEDEFIKRNKKVTPKYGDVIYCREGTIGNAGMVENEELCLAQRVVLLRPKRNIINEKFFLYGINSIILYKQALNNVSQTTSPRVNLSVIKNFLFPVPPIEEQNIIVSIVEAYLKKEEKMSDIQINSEMIDGIAQSILSKAFRGELGTNDPTEESAMELLKEVLSEDQLNN